MSLKSRNGAVYQTSSVSTNSSTTPAPAWTIRLPTMASAIFQAIKDRGAFIDAFNVPPGCRNSVQSCFQANFYFVFNIIIVCIRVWRHRRKYTLPACMRYCHTDLSPAWWQSVSFDTLRIIVVQNWADMIRDCPQWWLPHSRK